MLYYATMSAEMSNEHHASVPGEREDHACYEDIWFQSAQLHIKFLVS